MDFDSICWTKPSLAKSLDNKSSEWAQSRASWQFSGRSLQIPCPTFLAALLTAMLAMLLLNYFFASLHTYYQKLNDSERWNRNRDWQWHGTYSNSVLNFRFRVVFVAPQVWVLIKHGKFTTHYCVQLLWFMITLSRDMFRSPGSFLIYVTNSL